MRHKVRLACPLERLPLSGNHVSGRFEGRGLGGQRPSTVLLDSNRDRLVPLGVEILEHGRGGSQRDFVLTGSTAVDHADTNSLAIARHSPGRTSLFSKL